VLITKQLNLFHIFKYILKPNTS